MRPASRSPPPNLKKIFLLDFIPLFVCVYVCAQETRRLAVVDLDWANITAVDILAVMRSFAPEGGAGGCMCVKGGVP